MRLLDVGNVYRVKVEEKVYFTKRYKNGEEHEDFEYEDCECEQPFTAMTTMKLLNV